VSEAERTERERAIEDREALVDEREAVLDVLQESLDRVEDGHAAARANGQQAREQARRIRLRSQQVREASRQGHAAQGRAAAVAVGLLPLSSGRLGALHLYGRAPGALTDDDVDVAVVLAAYLAVALVTSTRVDQRDDKLGHLRRALDTSHPGVPPLHRRTSRRVTGRVAVRVGWRRGTARR
jgi:hypothetical protein